MRTAVAAFVALLLLVPATANARSVHATRQRALESQLVQQINAVRRAHDLRPLTTSASLASAATEHTRKMGVDGYFAHASFDATPFWKRIARWYPSRGWRSWSVGENLLYDSPDATAQASLRLWLDSPPHRKNLLDPGWRQIGVSAVHFNTAPGTYDSRQVTIVTADFGARR